MDSRTNSGRPHAPAPPKPDKRAPAFFFRTEQGNEPVRDWLKENLTPDERKLVGEDVKTVEYGWPIGMPACRPLGDGLHEVRTNLPTRIARVLFYVDERERMVLLHGFFKKDRQIPAADMKLARARKAEHETAVERARKTGKRR
jgi:phage-related protein